MWRIEAIRIILWMEGECNGKRRVGAVDDVWNG
jgi:hypothetical protein